MTSLLDVQGGVAGARWQDVEQLHLTLRFIGDVDRRVADDVVLALESLTFAPLELRLAGVGAFDRKGEGRPIWAGVAPHDGLHQLHKKIDNGLVRAGITPEHRAYHPHITLARFGRVKGDIGDWQAAHDGLTSDLFLLDHIALYESMIGSDGARYQEVMRVASKARV